MVQRHSGRNSQLYRRRLRLLDCRHPGLAAWLNSLSRFAPAHSPKRNWKAMMSLPDLQSMNLDSAMVSASTPGTGRAVVVQHTIAELLTAAEPHGQVWSIV